jgi:hypothetical protein
MERWMYWSWGNRLLRYGHAARGFPRGAWLARDDTWQPSELPERNLWLGSDYGDEITAAEVSP